MYTTDDGKKNKAIQAYNLSTLQFLGLTKCSNAKVSKILIDYSHHRLYAATKEGVLLFFDISEALPAY